MIMNATIKVDNPIHATQTIYGQKQSSMNY